MKWHKCLSFQPCFLGRNTVLFSCRCNLLSTHVAWLGSKRTNSSHTPCPAHSCSHHSCRGESVWIAAEGEEGGRGGRWEERVRRGRSDKERVWVERGMIQAVMDGIVEYRGGGWDMFGRGCGIPTAWSTRRRHHLSIGCRHGYTGGRDTGMVCPCDN